MDEDVSALVRALADRAAIERVIHTYCECFDRNDPDGVAALFTSDAVIDYNPASSHISGSELRDVVAAGLRDTFAATSHHVSNFMIDFDGPDTARSLCYLDAWHRYHDGSPDGYLWGRYRHRLVRTIDGWRITELVLEAAGTIDFHRPTMHGIGRA
jgi:uncharacterized protein (TIGR02246 family)